LDGFDPLAIEVLRAEEDSLRTLMSLSPTERKKKYAAAKKEVMPLIRAGQAHADEMGIEFEYWLRHLA
jgi:isopropylmalate/homocitrate/citramalate synthase